VSATTTVACGSCGAQTPAGKKFCIHCGSAVRHACPTCGEPVLAGAKFCAECGTALGGTSSPAAASLVSAVPISERRLVSVLFADLVGFTTLSEHRDPEEVRELLSQYFDRCRSLIERYGGTVEKFIGDAVMAVWGTPVAREDDAERAVRAALALTGAVTALGEEVGMPELRVRAGVLTGSAAVEVGAEGEGMVLGDTVNTASRLQSIAEPGTVLVDDVTRRASEAAIAYEDAGEHHVKGRDNPVHAWTALRVVAGTGGSRRSAGVEAPLIGRARELELIIAAGEESAHQSQARHVAVVGEAGSGKSRLLWEFFKYLDGIEEGRYWHQGRCLSYGEGVSYWALAEMVRARAGIIEEEDAGAGRAKLRAIVERFVTDERERRLVEPRLGHLLRLEERPEADRADLFSGWRLFFERMAADSPVVLAFEDLQWADSGLLDFIDYLLEWSAEHPIFVISLGRPELRQRRPAWRSLDLGSMSAESITAILEGLAPGLPEDLVTRIVRRAEGIPLYAVETIRMLQDRGVLTQEGARYVLTGDVTDLDVPETLQALVASRLDGLSSGERSLLQDASVLGQSFTAAGASALSGKTEAEVVPELDGLVARQVLGRDDDPRSPERGHYVFLQALLRTVAYGTLSRRARKVRHLAAAHHLEQAWPGEARDIAEVLASHYLEAIGAEPDASDVSALRAAARERLTAAGQAAASLSLGPEAQHYFEHAAELAEDDLERAGLFEQAGRALWKVGDSSAAEERLRHALELYKRGGRQTGGSAAVTLANLVTNSGRMEEARELLEVFRSELPGNDPVLRAEALAELGRLLVLGGVPEQGGPVLEEALNTLELEQAWAPLTTALINRFIYLIYVFRREEATGVLRHALSLAEQHGLSSTALRARFNLVAVGMETGRFVTAVEEAHEALALTRERGDRQWERQMLSQLAAPLAILGRWDEAATVCDELIGGPFSIEAMTGAAFLITVAAARGEESTVERCRALALPHVDSSYVDLRMCAGLTLARDAIEHQDPERALDLARTALAERGTGSELVTEAYGLAVEASMAIDEDAAMDELISFVADLPPGRSSPLLRAGADRLAAQREHSRGNDEAALTYETSAVQLLREASARPLLAQALLESARRREDAGALAEARGIYRDVRATRWLERAEERWGAAA
jgi:class 3 adenylate cyclase/tetratricopeptide (TPR) repeat protein